MDLKHTQIAIETQFNRKLISRLIEEDFNKQEELLELIPQCVERLEFWLSHSFYESKDLRLNQLKELNLTELVTNLLKGMAVFFRPELLSSVAAQLAHLVGFSDKPDAVKTIAEIIGVLSIFDIYSLDRNGDRGSVYFSSKIPLAQSTYEYITNCMYLPPMLCKPELLTSNYCSGYLTHVDSLILNNNHHNGDISLDVLNNRNQIPLALNLEFLSTVEEKPNPTKEMNQSQQVINWSQHVKQSHNVYVLISSKGNKFYLNHKWDSRGRMYCQGYHVNYQGASYKKAMVDLYDQEEVTGVPEHLLIKE